MAALEKHFEAIGAAVRQESRNTAGFAIDVRSNARGEEQFVIVNEHLADLSLLQKVPEERHLLVFDHKTNERFLCGHDERHWFVASIDKPVSTVRAAKESLLPKEVLEQIHQLSPEERLKRKNKLFVRQGEWFFVPIGKELVNPVIHRDEPISRGRGSKEHICQELVRTGGRTVWLFKRRIIQSQEEFETLSPEERVRATRRVADAEVYVRGTVTHPDHSTLVLEGWHRVLMNAERVSASVLFLD